MSRSFDPFGGPGPRAPFAAAANATSKARDERERGSASGSGSDDGYRDFAEPKDDEEGSLTSQSLNADGTPKRPMNAFMIFARRRRPQVSAENQSMRTGEISKILSKEWTTMSTTDKQFYLDQAKQLKENFNSKYPDYVYRRRPNNSRKKRKTDAAFSPADGADPDAGLDSPSLDAHLDLHPPSAYPRAGPFDSHARMPTYPGAFQHDRMFSTGNEHHRLGHSASTPRLANVNGYPAYGGTGTTGNVYPSTNSNGSSNTNSSGGGGTPAWLASPKYASHSHSQTHPHSHYSSPSPTSTVGTGNGNGNSYPFPQTHTHTHTPTTTTTLPAISTGFTYPGYASSVSGGSPYDSARPYDSAQPRTPAFDSASGRAAFDRSSASAFDRSSAFDSAAGRAAFDRSTPFDRFDRGFDSSRYTSTTSTTTNGNGSSGSSPAPGSRDDAFGGLPLAGTGRRAGGMLPGVSSLGSPWD